MTPQEVKYIVVHCSATSPEADWKLEDIDRAHRKKGWLGVGYHFVIERDGTIRKGRDLDRVGAHAYGHNNHSIGICLSGGVNAEGKPEDNYTEDQTQSLALLLLELYPKYGHATVLGHRDLSPDTDGDGEVEPHEWLKQCPCFDVKSWVKQWHLNFYYKGNL